MRPAARAFVANLFVAGVPLVALVLVLMEPTFPGHLGNAVKIIWEFIWGFAAPPPIRLALCCLPVRVLTACRFQVALAVERGAVAVPRSSSDRKLFSNSGLYGR